MNSTDIQKAEAAAAGCSLVQQEVVRYAYTRRGWQGRPKPALKTAKIWQVVGQGGKVLAAGKSPAQAMKRWRAGRIAA